MIKVGKSPCEEPDLQKILAYIIIIMFDTGEWVKCEVDAIDNIGIAISIKSVGLITFNKDYDFKPLNENLTIYDII